MKTHILIFSYLIDTHARAVRWALRKQGFSCSIAETVSYPSKQSASVYMSDTGDCSVHLRPVGYVDGDDCQLTASTVRAVWNRRPDWYRFDVSTVNAHDVGACLRESSAFVRSMHCVFSAGSRWVNSLEGQLVGSVKINQLIAAAQAGLRVPETCMSNDPDEVRSFVSDQGGKALCKPFVQKSWKKASKTYLQLASIVTDSDLASDLSIQNSPSIFQSYIEKQFEVRVVVLGDSYKALRLNSQENENAMLDWRGDRFGNITVEECSLPTRVWRALRDTFDSLKIEFGCVDLIVTPDGEYVFLEVNEQGQFLWMEEKVPDIRLLAAFSEFLTGLNADDVHYPTLSDYVCSRDYDRLQRDTTLQSYRQLSLVHVEAEK